MALFTGTRLNCLRLTSTRITAQLSCHRSVRLFSSVIPRARTVPKTNVFLIPQYSRSYWWSTPKSDPPSSESVLPSPPEPTVEASPIESEEIMSAEPVSATISSEPFTDTPTDTLIDVSPTGPPPLEFGDFGELGLLSWTPAGLVRWTIEIIQVTTGLPWFHTIIVATLLWRVVLMPMSVASIRNSARMLPVTPRMLAVKTEMAAAQKNGDKLALQRAGLKQRKIYADAGVSMGSVLLAPFVQVPVTLGLFFGIKKICELPVEQLKTSGLDILPDLTVADPYFALPIIATIAINLQISAGAKEMNLVERPEMGHFMNLLRVLSVAGIYFLGNLPSGLLVSLITGVSATAVQSLALRYLPLRRALNIPVIPPQYQGRIPTFKESIDFVVKTFKERQVEAHRLAMKQRRRRT